MRIHLLISVAIGGAVGSVARVLLSHYVSAACGTRLPWGTLFVNLLGCFVLGWIAQRTADAIPPWSLEWQMLIGPGFLGGFTTFSTFSSETLLVWQRSPTLGVANVGLNVGLGLAAAAVGGWFARSGS